MKTGLVSAYFYSVLLHALLLGMLIFSFGWRQFSQAQAPPPVLALQAQVVDEDLIAAELDKLQAADRRRAEAARQRQRDLEEQAARVRAEREKEEQRLAEIERDRVAAQQRAAEEAAARQAERVRTERELAEAEARERQRLAELEQAREAEEQRLAALAEQRRKEEAARAEQARLAAVAEQRRREEAAKKAELQEQLRRAMAEESARREAEEAGLLDEYVALIEQRIVRNWIKPPSAGAGLKCELLVTQIPGGDVRDVEIVRCNGDAAVLHSIKSAVYKASPLPPPPDPRLFERKVRVFFEPDS